jgi:hypothetical protein
MSQNQKQFHEEFVRLTDQIWQQLSDGKQSAAYLTYNRLGQHIRRGWKITTSAEAAWNHEEATERREIQ